MKRFLTFVLASCMLLSVAPVLAEETEPTQTEEIQISPVDYPEANYQFSGDYVKHKELMEHKVDPKVLDSYAGQHPRLFFDADGFEALREKVKEGGKLHEKWTRFIRSVDAAAAEELPEWYLSDNAEENWMRDIGDNLNNIALAGAVTKDPKYIKAAEYYIETLCGYPHWGLPGSSYYNNDLACAHASRGLALAYDWLFDDLSQFHKDMILEAAKTRTKTMHGGAWWNRSYLQNHLWNTRLGTAVMAFAIMDEYPESRAWIDKSASDYDSVAYYLGIDGGSHEGMLYWNYGMETYTLWKWFSKHQLGMDYTEDLFDVNSYLAPLYSYYNPQDWTSKNWAMMYGDSTPNAGGGASLSSYLDYFAVTYNNGVAKWLANRYYDYLVKNDGGFGTWHGFLFDNDVEEVEPASVLPTANHFEDLGIVQSRSGWNENASYVHVRCGQPLGTEAMSFSKNGNLGSGHVHMDINAPVIFGYGEYILREDGYTKGDRKNHSTLYINGDGQPRSTAVEYLQNMQAVILKYKDTAEYTYIVGDGTDAYMALPAWQEEYKLEKWVRHFLYLKRKDCLIMIDEVECEVEQDLQLQWITGVTTLSNQGPNSIIGKGQTAQFKITNFDNTGEGGTVVEPREVPYMTATRNVATVNKRAKDWTTATAVTWSPADRSPRNVKLDRYNDEWTFDLDTAVVTLNIKTSDIKFVDYGNDLRVKLDRAFLKTDLGILLENDNQYMPFRDLFEGMGYKVNYLADSHSAEVISGDERKIFALSDSQEEGKLWVKDGHTRITPDQMITMANIIAYFDDANNIVKVKTYDFDNDTSLANVMLSGGFGLSSKLEGDTMTIVAMEDTGFSLNAVPVSASAQATIEKVSDLEYKATVTAEDRTSTADYKILIQYPVGLGDCAVKRVTTIGDDGNIGPNSVDGVLSSYWAYDGTSWGIYEFDKEYTIDKIQTSWNSYHKRDAYYELYTSMDGENWNMLGDYVGLTGVQFNDVTFAPTTCKYIKVVGKGNSINGWSSLSDIGFFQTK